MLLSTKLSKKWWVLLKIVVLGFVIYFVVQSLYQHRADFDQLATQSKHLLLPLNIELLVIVILLSVVNWAMEALKWQILVQEIEQTTFKQAFMGVLLGLSMGFISPLNLGEFVGRLSGLQTQNRAKSIGAVLMGSSLQTYITLFFGTWGWGYFIVKTLPNPSTIHWVFWSLCMVSLGLGIGLFFCREKIPKMQWKHLQIPLQIIADYQPITILRALWAGIGRYLIFVVQFLLILQIFDIQLPLSDALMVIVLVFFAKTFIPTFSFLSDLGVREMTAIYFFEFFAISPVKVVMATFGLWLLNILLPVLVGSFFIIGEKK